MVGDDFRQVVRIGALWYDGGRVRNVLEEGPVGEECASRDEHYARVRPSVTCEVGNRDGASVFQHDIQDQNLGLVGAKMINGVVLAGEYLHFIVLPLQMPGPEFGKFRI